MMLTETTAPDGYGGYTMTWKNGTRFMAAITFDNSIAAKQAEAAGVTSVYTVTTGRSTVLKFHDVFKRCSDKKIFRVTSDGDDRFTPASTPLDMRQVSAEEWELPHG